MTTHATYSLLRRGHLELTVAASIAGWLVVLAAAWSYLSLYDLSTGEKRSNAMVTGWPSESRIVRDARHPTLLLFLHPKCPCSRATLRELERAFANVPDDSPNLFVVATVPDDAPKHWHESTTVNAAQQLPKAVLFVDPGGAEAARFGARVSGQLMLFDAAGRRLFAGGVTPARGHEGANPGVDGLTALLRNESNPHRDFPAFGCQLCLPDESIPKQQMAANAVSKQESHP